MAKEILLDFVLASGVTPDDWQTWTPVGPGGNRGARRVKRGQAWQSASKSDAEALETIREIYEERKIYWRTDFVELDLTDVQFQLCEFDKYSRVAEGRRPKRQFRPTNDWITNHASSR